eukprot:m.44364 g.44364  ORF g.44364 m.44364 type:complete len:408 (-) comp12108_c0_seq1:2263-3486(-)
MRRGLAIATALLLLLLCGLQADADISAQAAFDAVVQGPVPAFIKFYAPWCGHCKRLEPTWRQLTHEYEANANVIITRIDCTQHEAICVHEGIRGYPTLKFYAGNGQRGITYTEGRSLEALMNYVNEQLAELIDLDDIPGSEVSSDHSSSAAPEYETTADGVALLEDAHQLHELLRKGQRVFVMFMTTWCPHCREAKPVFTGLTERFSSAPSLTIAMVDCGLFARFCTDEQIKGYPSFWLYSPNHPRVAYNEDRSIGGFVTFIQEQLRRENTRLGQDQPQQTTSPDLTITENGLQLTSENFQQGIKAASLVVVKAFVPWCAYSQRMSGAWKAVVAKYKDRRDVVVAELDCSQYPATCQQASVSGYPQLIAYRGGRKFRVFEGKRTADAIVAFIEILQGRSQRTGHDEL